MRLEEFIEVLKLRLFEDLEAFKAVEPLDSLHLGVDGDIISVEDKIFVVLFMSFEEV